MPERQLQDDLLPTGLFKELPEMAMVYFLSLGATPSGRSSMSSQAAETWSNLIALDR
jgi:hypothetical protein